MGHRRALLGLLATASIATSFAACQTPTSMTVVVSTDVICQELETKSDATIIVGRAAEDLLDLENVASSKRCEAEGAIGEVVLLPQGDEATEVAFKIVLGVGRETRDCGIEDPNVPGGPWGACIVARRRLAFLDGEALVVEVPLYERCIGVTCSDGEGDSPFTTCNAKGECVPADLDPEDCLTGCGEEQLQGTVTNAAATGAGGDGGASSTGDSTSTAGGDAGGGGAGGAPGCVEGSECLLDGQSAGVCDADGACVACLDASDCELTPSQEVCADSICSSGICGVSLVGESLPCEGRPGVCDGTGTCVECVVASDCASASEECENGFCQPLTCSDGARNGDETDLDCGGDACAPCANGFTCGAAENPAVPENESCLSGSCQPDGAGALVCASCVADAECSDGFFCHAPSGTCTEPLANGEPCVDDSWCDSGTCAIRPGQAAGICCSEACGDPCESCDGNETGANSGTCAPVLTGASCGDPFCPSSQLAVELRCSASMQCSPVPTDCAAGEVCDDGECVDDGTTTSTTTTSTTTTSTTTGSGVGGGGDGGASATSSTTLTGVGGSGGVGGSMPTSSTGPAVDCQSDVECTAIDPTCFCSMGTCICAVMPSTGSGI